MFVIVVMKNIYSNLEKWETLKVPFGRRWLDGAHSMDFGKNLGSGRSEQPPTIVDEHLENFDEYRPRDVKDTSALHLQISVFFMS